MNRVHRQRDQMIDEKRVAAERVAQSRVRLVEGN